jgi:lipoyl(octanoyl) transferase
MNLNIIDLKREKYNRALKIQETLQLLRIEDRVEDTFILVEHPPVLTMGRRGKEGNVLASQETLDGERIETVWINRGGDVTYHGPGQIVGYPIIHLAKNDIGIRVFVEKIQQTIIDYLKNEHGISAEKKSGVHTGVWVDEKKICAIGVSVSRNVTMHGFAFNVNTNLDHFGYINPCGLGVGSVTSLKEITGRKIDFEAAKEKIIKYFCASFDAQPFYKKAEELIGEI